MDPVEQCDDGNVADGDGCSSSCQLESAMVGTGSLVGTGTATPQSGQAGTTTDMDMKRRPIPYVFGAPLPAPVLISTPPVLPLAG